MLSLAASFRAVVRRQPSKLPSVAATRAVSSPAHKNASSNPQVASELSDVVLDAAEEQEMILAGRAGELQDNILDTPAANDKSYPILNGFQAGQFTRPKSFSREENNKGRPWTKRPLLGPDAATSKEYDIFHQLNIDPLKECRNTSLLCHFVTPLGKIRGRSQTNLTWKNQRRMGKAIRRAKMMGIIPVLSRRSLFFDDKVIP